MPAKKKTNAAELLNLDGNDDDDESELTLYSLGSFFVPLIDNDCYQVDAEGSKPIPEEVNIISCNMKLAA